MFRKEFLLKKLELNNNQIKDKKIFVRRRLTNIFLVF